MTNTIPYRSSSSTRTLLGLLLLGTLACNDTAASPTSPGGISVPPAAGWMTALVESDFVLSRASDSELQSLWKGSSKVMAVRNVPACSSGGWPIDHEQTIDAEILLQDDGALDMHLFVPEESRHACHLELKVDGTKISAAPWTDIFGDSVSCHFALSTSSWSCEPEISEAWILGVEVEGAFENGSRRIRGTLSASYDYR